jgi:hypothetical protein
MLHSCSFVLPSLKRERQSFVNTNFKVLCIKGSKEDIVDLKYNVVYWLHYIVKK